MEEKIPIVVLVKERPKMLKAMVDSIVRFTDPSTYRLIFVDNASESEEAVSYLSDLECNHTVIRNQKNWGLNGFNYGFETVEEEFFIISDPDIRLNSEIPSDWVYQFRQALIEFSHINKIGVALNIDFASNRRIVDEIKRWERRYWGDPISLLPVISEPCFNALIATTLSMYRSKTYRCGNGKIRFSAVRSAPAIRVGGRFTAEHLGWDVYNEYVEDIKFYAKRCSTAIAGTVKYLISQENEIYA